MKVLLALLICSLPSITLAAPVRELTVAVVQFESADGDVQGNLNTADGWVGQAVAAGAQLILFPEFMPVGYQLSPALWDSGETMSGRTVSWLKRQSATHRIWMGTSFLEVDGEHFYDTFVLTSPKGQVAGKVRKEVPASSEAYFFNGDINDHVIETELGRIGVMICYENYLARIANKVAAARVDLLLSPFSFPESPGAGAQPLSGSEYAGFYAAKLGIPVAAVNKVGKWRSPIPQYPGFITNGEFPGSSAIARADGSIAAKADRQAGFAIAKVSLDPKAKKSNVVFPGAFVEGVAGQAGDPDDVRAQVDAKGVASYVGSAERRTKALHRSGAPPVGEILRVTSSPTAALRDADHRSELRITVWYPAAPDAVERAVTIGPPDQPLFDVGAVASDAPFRSQDGGLPVILLSHGFGGTARMMGWFGIAMAREGYIVVAVDHPGNNTVDKMTVAGAVLWWDRPDDLRAALTATMTDPLIGPHMDLTRVGVAGFSAGGFTALVAAGAKVEPDRLKRFCIANPDDGVCRPQQEFVVTARDAELELKRPEIQEEVARATADHSIPRVRAAFAMAPAIVQALEPSSLARMRTPVEIILGDADTVAPPATNGVVAATTIPDASLIRLPGAGHYDFLSSCTESGHAIVAVCKSSFMQTEAHRAAIDAAKTFFLRQLSAPSSL